MELKSCDTYIEKLIYESFTFEMFSPENSGSLYSQFKSIFTKQSPYWTNNTSNGNMFSIEFKKYGENRKRAFLKFSFLSNINNPRRLELALMDDKGEKLKDIIDIGFSDIWKNHSILTNHLKDLLKYGLNAAEQI